ncbi:MAG TPA: hypothetical protein VHL09_02260 [Dehalococcoidia bacterium]|nr:hypothetical protein [Dehalococcoidia bacterium]
MTPPPNARGSRALTSALSQPERGVPARFLARLPAPRRAGAGGLIALLVLIALGSALALALPRWWSAHQPELVAWTGETEAIQQVGGLVLPLFQRRPVTADLAALPHTDRPPFGVNVFFEQEVEPERLVRSLEMLRAIGVTMVRQQIPWSDIEIPAKGRYVNDYGQHTWEKYDRLIDLTQQYGLTLVARLDFPPDWTRQDNRNTFAPPDRLEDYGDFVAAFAERYRGRVKYLQIWNEPNIYPEWGEGKVDPAGYAQMLRVAATRARAVNPDVVIVAAALAPTLGTPDGRNLSDVEFLQGMYDAGAAPYFDILATQAYGLWTGPGDRRLAADRTNFSRPQIIREIMVRNGDAAKPVWATEMGWNALPDDFPKSATHGRVTRDQQAEYLAQGFERSLNEWPWLGAIFYWHFRMVHAENRDQVHYYFGLADSDFNTYPAYDAYRSVATAPPVMRYGRHQSSDWTIAYSGVWEDVAEPRAELGRYQRSADPAAGLTFTFRGTGLDLIAPTGPDWAPLTVTIDGRPVGGGPISLAEPAGWQTPLPLARHLADGDHRVEVRPAGPGAIGVDAFIVYRSPEVAWLPLLGAVFAVAAGVTLVWTLWRQR